MSENSIDPDVDYLLGLTVGWGISSLGFGHRSRRGCIAPLVTIGCPRRWEMLSGWLLPYLSGWATGVRGDLKGVTFSSDCRWQWLCCPLAM